MEYFLLGPLEARENGALVPLPAGKQRALLADLLLHANRVVAVEQLVDDLWGDAVPDTAVKSLQVHVSKLRRALPDAAIETRPPGYVLQLDDDALDLHRFERLVAEGRVALAEGRAAAASALLCEALALWRGPALADVEEPFAAASAVPLEELRISCLEERIEADLALGRHAPLVGEIEVATREHPFRERLRAQLVLALYRSGRQAEALAALQTFRRSLRDELGIEPSEELRDLERRILRQDASLLERPVADGARERPDAIRVPGPRDPRVVGRDAELARLGELLGDAVSGERRVVFVTGEPGAGKTTLVETFLATARLPEGGRVGRGQCIEHRGAGEPYLPVLEALGRLCRAEHGAEMVALLRLHAPTWLVQLPSLVSGDELDALRARVLGATRERMLREMVELLDAAAAAASFVLVLEDLHWSDLSTLDLLEAVARRPDPARLLVVGTFRPTDPAAAAEPVRKLARDLGLRGLCAEIAVRGLAEDAVRAYVGVRLPGLESDDGVVELLRARANGNPLFVEKLIEAWSTGGCLAESGGHWRAVAGHDRLASLVPESLQQLIGMRLDLLDDDGRAVLDAAAIVGTTFATPVVAAASGRPLATVDALCDRLARDHLFVADAGSRPWPDGSVASTYAFTHDLCQEVLADALPPGTRAALHDAVASYLEGLGEAATDELAVEIAWHASNGSDRERAVRHLLRAAQRAIERNAFQEARAHLGSATEAIATLTARASSSRLELEALSLVGATEIALDGWGSRAAEEAYERARELAARLGAADELALVLFRLATVHEFRGEYRLSESLLEESFALPSDDARPTRSVYNHELLACSLFHQGDHHGAIHHAETALSLFDGVVDPLTATTGETPEVTCHIWAALALWHLGHPDQALERADRAVAASTLGAARSGRAMAQAQAAVVALCRGEVASALRWSDAALASSAELGYPYWRAVGLVAHGAAAAHDGRAGEGIAEIRDGIALARATGALMDVPFFLALLAEAALADGRPDDAAAALDEARPSDHDGREFFYGPELLRLGALVEATRGATDTARTGLRAAIAAAHDLGALSLELRAATSLTRLEAETAGDTQGAASELATVLGRFREGEATGDVRAARALLAEVGVAAQPTDDGQGHRGLAPGAQPVSYADSGGLSIAYQISGGGPLDIVLVPGFVSHLDLDWANSGHARLLDRLGSWGRLIRFDKRGTGLSDRAVGLPDLETRMDDVRAVMDAAGSERAVLLGYSEGGPLSILYAATYPERVRALVLYAAFVKRLDPDDDYPWAPSREERAAFVERIGAEWGFEADMRVMCPSADEETARWWGERSRAAASPGGIRALMEMNSLVDVRDVLPTIRVPTLVVHRSGDLDVSVEEARYIAARIPGARLVELPGIDHFPSIDSDQILDAVEPFVAEVAEAPLGGPGADLDARVLATILMTDVVGSTERLRSLGDRDWADLLERHHAIVRGELGRFRGVEVDDAGDGFLALFDGPARAVRCGLAIAARVRELGLGLRVGVHTGEVERRGRAARGVAIHLAARVMAEAEEGQVLATETTRDLTEGSGLRFDDRGERRLKGFDRPRRLFAAREGRT